MPEIKYQLKEVLPEETTTRIKEVQFYLLIQSFFSKYGTQNTYVIQLIESLARLYGCKPTVINIIIANLCNPLYEPSKLEIIVASKYIGLTVRSVQKLTGISQSTHYKYLQEYIDQGEPTLTPRLTNDMVDQITLFLDNAQQMFSSISEVLKEVEFDYDD